MSYGPTRARHIGYSCGTNVGFYSAVGRLITTVAYGEEMWKTTGEDLNAWNVEMMHYISEALFNFWPVDVFNFCKYSHHRTDVYGRGFIYLSTVRFIPSWTPGAYFK